MVLLRIPQDRRISFDHHQLDRVRYRDSIHSHILHVCTEGGKGAQNVAHGQVFLTIARKSIYTYVYSPSLDMFAFGLQIFTAKLVLLVNVGMFGLILLLTLLLAEGSKRVRAFGWICVSFSVSVFVAPLSVIVST